MDARPVGSLGRGASYSLSTRGGLGKRYQTANRCGLRSDRPCAACRAIVHHRAISGLLSDFGATSLHRFKAAVRNRATRTTARGAAHERATRLGCQMPPSPKNGNSSRPIAHRTTFRTHANAEGTKDNGLRNPSVPQGGHHAHDNQPHGRHQEPQDDEDEQHVLHEVGDRSLPPETPHPPNHVGQQQRPRAPQ